MLTTDCRLRRVAVGASVDAQLCSEPVTSFSPCDSAVACAGTHFILLIRHQSGCRFMVIVIVEPPRTGKLLRADKL